MAVPPAEGDEGAAAAATGTPAAAEGAVPDPHAGGEPGQPWDGGGAASAEEDAGYGDADAAAAQRRKSCRLRRKKKAARERQRVDAAMRLLDDAKAKAEADRMEYGRYLSWKVSMQRKERAQRDKAEGQRFAAAEANLAHVLHRHKLGVAESKRQWRQFAENKAVAVRRAPAAAALADVRHMEYVQQRRDDRQSRRKLLAGASGVPMSPAAQLECSPREPAQAQQGVVVPRTTYEDFTRILSDDLLQRRGADDQCASVQRKLITTQRRRDQRLARVATMYDLASQRRSAAMSTLQRDPPAEALLEHDVTRYLPPDFAKAVERELRTGMTGFPAGGRSRAAAAQGSDFFLTEVDDDTRALQAQDSCTDGEGPRPPPGRGRAASLRRKSHTRLVTQTPWIVQVMPQQPPTAPLLHSRHRRESEEREHLRDYLEAVSRGYHRPTNRTEYHGRSYSWTRQHRHTLPDQKRFAVAGLVTR